MTNLKRIVEHITPDGKTSAAFYRDDVTSQMLHRIVEKIGVDYADELISGEHQCICGFRGSTEEMNEHLREANR